MEKCVANKNELCKSRYSFDIPCDGYSTECQLKPHYDYVAREIKNGKESLKKALGIKGDK